jgi:hypothetical protein
MINDFRQPLYMQCEDFGIKPRKPHLQAVEEIKSIIDQTDQSNVNQQLEAVWKKYPECHPTMGGFVRTIWWNSVLEEDLNAKETALHYAVAKMNLEAVKFLVKKKSDEKDLEIYNDESDRYTPLQLAFTAVQPHTLVIRDGYEANEDDKKTFLDIARVLLQAGANANSLFESWFSDEPGDGFVPTLLTAALTSKESFFKEFAKLLMQYGAVKLAELTKDGKGLIEQSLSKEQNSLYEEIKEEIKEVEFTFFSGTQDRCSPIFSLSKEVVGYLLERGRAETAFHKTIEKTKKMLNLGCLGSDPDCYPNLT